MAISDATIIGRSMSGRMFSTVTTTLTVAVAVALLLVLLGMRDSGQRAFSRGSGNMHLVVSRDTGPLAAVLNNVFHAGTPKDSLTWSQYDALVNGVRPGVPPVSVMTAWTVPLQSGDSYFGFPVVATSGAFFERFRPVADRPLEVEPGGRWFESPIERALRLEEPLRFRVGSAAMEGVVGAEVRRATGLSVGSRILVTHGTGDGVGHVHKEDEITIVGVLRRTGTAHDRAIFIDLGTSWLMHARDFHEVEVARAAGLAEAAAERGEAPPRAVGSLEEYVATMYEPRITGIYVRAAARDGSEAPPVLPQLFSTLRGDSVVGAVASPSDQIAGLFRIVGNINQVLVGMAAVVMVTSGISIMLALYNSMEQRRRQIAVLRVLGASRRRIFGLIVTESAVIGLAGALAGVLLGATGSWLVADVMRDRLGLAIEPSVWVMQAVEVGGRDVVLPLTPLVLLAAVALAAAAGVVPAVMAYRTSVARSLRPLG